jgi:uncharacterized integral membrane protein (TIGR00698 family)
MEWLNKNARGLFLSVGLAALAIIFSPYIPGLNGIMLALVLGLILGNAYTLPSSFSPGVSFGGSKILEFSIVFMAFTLNISDFRQLGTANLIIVLSMMMFTLLSTIWLAKKLSCPDSTGHLVGFGTVVCGSSAIAAVAPGISKSQNDIAIALAVVNLMGSVGMIALPFVLEPLGLSEIDKGVIVGGTLHSVGNVAGAGYGIEKSVGDFAISVKMARVAMLTPAVIFFTYLVRRGEASSKEVSTKFKLPLYLWAFLIISILVSIFPLPKLFLGAMSDAAKMLLTVAMAAIGLKVSFAGLYRSGRKAIGFGAIIFGVQIAILSTLMLLSKVLG